MTWPSNVTVSGDGTLVGKLGALLKEDQIFQRELRVENAYYSAHMLKIANHYLKAIEDLNPSTNANGVTMISSVTGEIMDAEDLGPSYWVRNMVSPVLFLKAIEFAFPRPEGSAAQG